MTNKQTSALSLLAAPIALAIAVLVCGADAPRQLPAPQAEVTSYIVQGASVDDVIHRVQQTGGAITHELGIIRGVAAELTTAQRRALMQAGPGLRITGNRTTELAKKPVNDPGDNPATMVETFYPTHLGADLLHAEGIDGSGVTIAVIDSGIFSDNGLTKNGSGQSRVLASYDPVEDDYVTQEDPFGHGSHVTSIAISSRQADSGLYNGMAPGADLVEVQAFDQTGRSTYADVIRGIDWVVSNKNVYGIRVLNCSFSAEPQSYYWDDPLNQAVMEAWRAGIVVVASAGNRGPNAMSIGVPGNVPYIITAGAMTDNYTPEDMTDDVLATFSSAGPTVEGFVKPDVVAPGGHVLGLMKHTAQIATDHPEFHDGGYYFNMSGTSQATAFVSGVLALMLQADPTLTPDEAKYRLMETAKPAGWESGGYTYTVFQQGAGLVDAYDAAHSTALGNAHASMDIDLDLAGIQHYGGPADAYEQGKRNNIRTYYFVRDANGDPIEDDGFFWSDEYVEENGFFWSDGFLWSDGFMWSDGFLWSDGFFWSDGFMWSDGFVNTDLTTEALFTESWVEPE